MKIKLNGYEVDIVFVKDILIIIGIVASAIIFIWRGEAHRTNGEIHLNRTEKAMLDYLQKTNFPEWRNDIDKQLLLRDTKVKEIVDKSIKETIKELREQGYLKPIKEK